MTLRTTSSSRAGAVVLLVFTDRHLILQIVLQMHFNLAHIVTSQNVAHYLALDVHLYLFIASAASRNIDMQSVVNVTISREPRMTPQSRLL